MVVLVLALAHAAGAHLVAAMVALKMVSGQLATTVPTAAAWT